MRIGRYAPYRSPILPAMGWVIERAILGVLWAAAWVWTRLESQAENHGRPLRR